MDLDLKDKLIVITGGAAGIGEAITRASLAEGARVTILSRITPQVEAFLAAMRAQQARVDLIALELSDTAACAAAIRTLEQRHGDIFALVNNAGVNDSVSLTEGTLDQWSQSLANNLTHAFVLAQQALPSLQRARGTILNIASKVAVTGQGGTSGYAAAKGALLALTREWAVELLPFNIRVNAILPAEVMTPLYEAWLSRQRDPAERLAEIVQRIPLGHRMTTPAEIAAAAVFLLSPTQSAHTTGQHVFIDGGYTHLDRAAT